MSVLRDVRPFSLRLRRPLSTARGEVTHRRGMLVRVEVDGRPGIGESTPLPGWTESYDACRAALDAVTDPVAALTATDDADAASPLEGAPAARHGLALAVADASARRDDCSLAASLAARSTTTTDPAQSVPVNATVGDGPPEDTALETRTAVEAGYDCVKVKVGVGSVDRDVERLRAARKAVESPFELRADANGAYPRAAARRLLRAVTAAGVDLDYLEQPLEASDLAGHADLRRLSAEEGLGIDIAVDESLSTHAVEAVLDAGAADVLVCKPMALGGPDRTLAVASRAAAAGVDVVLTTTIDAVVARAGAVHTAAAVADVRACGLATGSLLESDLASDPVPVESGRVEVPRGPGLAGAAFEGLFE